MKHLAFVVLLGASALGQSVKGRVLPSLACTTPNGACTVATTPAPQRLPLYAERAKIKWTDAIDPNFCVLDLKTATCAKTVRTWHAVCPKDSIGRFGDSGTLTADSVVWCVLTGFSRPSDEEAIIIPGDADVAYFPPSCDAPEGEDCIDAYTQQVIPKWHHMIVGGPTVPVKPKKRHSAPKKRLVYWSDGTCTYAIDRDKGLRITTVGKNIACPAVPEHYCSIVGSDCAAPKKAGAK